ncbi:MAG: dihydropteroate synthase [Thermoguttaceae bacterium]|nr:dihydropteroate synthase [Thermoguttaceae bacterium]
MNDVWRLKTRTLPLDRPVLTGIINATPDSFSDGGQFSTDVNSAFQLDLTAVLDKARQLVRDGAAILDVGGESTRPGAEPVDEAEEIRRVVPVVKTIAQTLSVPISVDAYRPAVADAALEAGAEIVNDVSAGRYIATQNRFADENETNFPEEMADVVRRRDAAVVLTHMRGVPKTMQVEPRYDLGVFEEVFDFLRRRRDRFVELGIEADRIALDPGVGFGKTFEQNWELIRRAAEFSALSQPLYFGCSRKRFLIETLRRVADERQAVETNVPDLTSDARRFYEPLNPENAAERDAATAATTLLLAERGVRIFRVHNVLRSAIALKIFDSLEAVETPRHVVALSDGVSNQ